MAPDEISLGQCPQGDMVFFPGLSITERLGLGDQV